jgi:hypothetical protein
MPRDLSTRCKQCGSRRIAFKQFPCRYMRRCMDCNSRVASAHGKRKRLLARTAA